MKTTIELGPDDLQLIVMALAHLAVERPGWYEMLQDFASKLGGPKKEFSFNPENNVSQTESLFDRFYQLRQAKAPSEAGDSILQLRRVIEHENPMLWAMVSELAWPK